jgi:hypothetical protein
VARELGQLVEEQRAGVWQVMMMFLERSRRK